MKILDTPITLEQLRELAAIHFGDMIKAVVDVDKELLALEAEMHADLEAMLLENGSIQEHLWGINLYPDLPAEDLVEFDSMINMRPAQGNLGRGVDDESIRRSILAIVRKWVKM